MRRNLPQPLYPGILHRHAGIQPLGDGVADEGGALFLEEFDLALFFGDEGVYVGGFVVEEGGDGALRQCWQRYHRGARG